MLKLMILLMKKGKNVLDIHLRKFKKKEKISISVRKKTLHIS
jgi:hypothetical protein